MCGIEVEEFRFSFRFSFDRKDAEVLHESVDAWQQLGTVKWLKVYDAVT